MAIKVYTASICGSQEVRKQQQRVLFILSTLPLDLEIIDITEPGRDTDRDFMQEEVKKHNKTYLLPPQIFNDTTYCGDYDDFQLAADDDVIMSFLKLQEPPSEKVISNGISEDAAATTTTQNSILQENEVEHDAAENEMNMESIEETGEKTVDLSPETNIENEAANENVEVVTEVKKEAEQEESEEESSEEESD